MCLKLDINYKLIIFAVCLHSSTKRSHGLCQQCNWTDWGWAVDQLTLLNHTTFLRIDRSVDNNKYKGILFDNAADTRTKWKITVSLPDSEHIDEMIDGAAYDMNNQMLYLVHFCNKWTRVTCFNTNT